MTTRKHTCGQCSVTGDFAIDGGMVICPECGYEEELNKIVVRHTQGEWTVEPKGKSYVLVCNGRPYATGDIHSLNSLLEKIHQAAAAPKLLEALIKADVALVYEGYPKENSTRMIIAAAIAQAKGEQV